MPYENLGASKCRLGSFEGELGQEDSTAASSATSGVLTGIGQILGSVGQIGAQFYAAHAQSELAKERLKLQQRQPAVQPQFIPQPPPQSSVMPIILIVLAIVVVGGIIIYSQDDEGTPSPSPVVAGQAVQQPYAAQPRAKIIRRRVRKKPKKK